MTATLDLTSLVQNVSDSDEKLTRAPGAGRPALDNPFGPIIIDSWNGMADDESTGKTKVLTVENDKDRGKTGEPRNVTTIKGLIRRAAEAEGMGVKIVAQETKGGKPVAAGETGTKTVIRFAAKVKTERKRQTQPDGAVPAGTTVTDESAQQTEPSY